MRRWITVALISALVLLAGCSSKQQSASASSGGDKSNPAAATKSTTPTPTQPQGSTNPAPGGTLSNPTPTPVANPIATVETSMGTFKIRLYLDQAPITADNFVKLAKQHFYDGLIFHRVARQRDGSGFVIQAGDPYCSSKEPAEQQQCGSGGPGWTIPLEKAATDLKHDRAGVVAMARTQEPNSAGSQFYITLNPASFLDGKYAVFGQVSDGLDVVLAIGKVATDDHDRPLQPVLIKQITLEGH